MNVLSVIKPLKQKVWKEDIGKMFMMADLVLTNQQKILVQLKSCIVNYVILRVIVMFKCENTVL